MAKHAEPLNPRSGVSRYRRCSPSSAQPLVPEWKTFLAELPNEDAFKRLRRLAGWCSAQGIKPKEVTEENFSAFFVFLDTQSVLRNVRERWHEARRTWNKVIATPGSGFPSIENIAPARWSSRSLVF